MTRRPRLRIRPPKARASAVTPRESRASARRRTGARRQVDLDLYAGLIVGENQTFSLPARLSYDRGDPYAVRVVLDVGEGHSVVWLFARALMAEGLEQGTGYGDVHVWPGTGPYRGEVLMSLGSGQRNALLAIPAALLRSFLDRADALVAPGTEHRHLDLDTLVRRLTDPVPPTG